MLLAEELLFKKGVSFSKVSEWKQYMPILIPNRNEEEKIKLSIFIYFIDVYLY